MVRNRYYLKKEEKKDVMDRLLDYYPDAKAELNFTNPFELLIATMLSAQCTDVRVNIVTDKLFKKYRSPKDYCKADIYEIENYIRACGLYRSKAKNIKATCEILENIYGGKVPKSIEQMQKLPGVGRKTANVVGSNAFGIPAFAVDTHVFRVSNRIGLAKAKDVLNTEIQLQKAIDKDKWTRSHHALIFHGRKICSARKPKCEICPVNEKCLSYTKGIKND